MREVRVVISVVAAGGDNIERPPNQFENKPIVCLAASDHVEFAATWPSQFQLLSEASATDSDTEIE